MVFLACTFPQYVRKEGLKKCQNLIDQTTEYALEVNWEHTFTSDMNYMSYALRCTKPPSYKTMMYTGNKETQQGNQKETIKGLYIDQYHAVKHKSIITAQMDSSN